MDLMEYRAQGLFAKFGVPCNPGVVVDSLAELEAKKDELHYPLVIKAQVKIGGRGKAGGIKFADNFEEAKAAALRYDQIFGHGNFFLEMQDHGIPEQARVSSYVALRT